MNKENGLSPGIYTRHQLSNEDYHAGDGLSSSLIKEVSRSLAHAKALIEGPPKESKALLDGSLIHSAILEPDVYERDYILALNPADYPHAYRTMDQMKAALKEAGLKVTGKKEDLVARLKQAHPEALFWDELVKGSMKGRTIITEDQAAMSEGIRQAVAHHPVARNIFKSGHSEQSHVWIDPKTGEKCKCRFDHIRPDLKTGFDVKSTTDARQHAVIRDIVKYQYHVSAAWYLEGAAQTGIEIDSFAWIFIEKDPPYGIGLYLASEAMIEEGDAIARRNLEALSEAKQMGLWPGYDTDFNVVDLPKWARNLDNEE